MIFKMKTKKILLIDDKNRDADFNGYTFMESLKEDQKRNVDFYESINELISTNAQEDELKIKFDLNLYEYILIHDSFDDPLLKSGLKFLFIEQCYFAKVKVICFSASKTESNNPEEVPISKESLINNFIISRKQLYLNLANFIDFCKFSNIWNLEILYDSNYNFKRKAALILKEVFLQKLESSNEEAISGAEFDSLIELSGLSSKKQAIKDYYLKKEYPDIVNSLEELINKIG